MAISLHTATAAEPATSPATQAAVRLTLTSPKEWEIFQRKSPTEGTLHIEGRVEGLSGAWYLTATARENDNTSSTSLDHPESKTTRSAHLDDIADGITHFSFDLQPAGPGWQQLKIEVAAVEHPAVFLTVNHTAVGEVFVVGGQSNSTNWGEVRTTSLTGMVTVFDGNQWTLAADPLPGVDAGQGKGSPWCTFGDLMAQRFKVPIGIVPVGRGSTSVRQWLPKSDVVAIEPTKTYGLQKDNDGLWRSEGILFDRMSTRMKALDNAATQPGAHGFRAMLWHQGESDAHQAAGHTLPGKDYRAMLERIIEQSRKQIGWNAPWFVATATWGSPQSPEDPDIRAAQQAIVADGVALQGPDTDKLTGEYRQKNGTGVHMSEKGLKAHGTLWADIVTHWLQPQLQPTTPSPK